MADPVFVVVESTKAGDSVLGVFTSIERARAILADLPADRLNDYKVECHLPDEPLDIYTPWQVSIRYDGDVEAAEPIISCACCDEEETAGRASFIEAGGDLMRLAVWARSRGRAIVAAETQGRRLIEEGVWQRRMPMTQLLPFHAESRDGAAAPPT
jgi:hypothetical protein